MQLLSPLVLRCPGPLDAVICARCPTSFCVCVCVQIRVPLDAVVKEGRVKDVYPLQEAQTGEMHLTMEWAGIDLGDDDDAAAVQARTASDAALFAVPEGPEGDSAPVVAAVQAVEAAAEATPATGTVGVSGQ